MQSSVETIEATNLERGRCFFSEATPILDNEVAQLVVKGMLPTVGALLTGADDQLKAVQEQGVERFTNEELNEKLIDLQGRQLRAVVCGGAFDLWAMYPRGAAAITMAAEIHNRVADVLWNGRTFEGVSAIVAATAASTEAMAVCVGAFLVTGLAINAVDEGASKLIPAGVQRVRSYIESRRSGR